MTTYNHEKYIAQAIESALMQDTNFDYEIVIGEDCSTDRTREIVTGLQKKYPSKFRLLLHEKNLGMIPNFVQTLNACSGEYIAILEGDDYWTDPLKLQRQVDFLEANPEYGMVHSDYDILNEIQKKTVKSYNRFKRIIIPVGYVFEKLLIHNFIGTPTVCVRKSLLNSNIISELSKFKSWKMGDFPMWLEVSKNSMVGYLNNSMATYRFLENSVTHPIDKNKKIAFLNSSYNIRYYFLKKYGCSEKIKFEIKKNYYKRLLEHSFYSRNKKLAKKCYHYLTKIEKKIHIENILCLWGAQNYLCWLIIKMYLKYVKK